MNHTAQEMPSWELRTFDLFNLFKPLDEFQLPLLGLSPHGLGKIPESLGIGQVQRLKGRCTAAVTPSALPAPGATLFKFYGSLYWFYWFIVIWADPPW